MKLDLQKPVLVIAGNWNPAIFGSGPWVFHHIYGVPEGEEVKVTVVTQSASPEIPAPTPTNSITMLNGIGFSADQLRVRFYLNDFEKNLIGRVEEMAIRVVEVLPHTPVGAFGCNFLFIEEDPEDVVVDRLKINDGIHEKYPIKTQIFKSVIAYDKNIDLNFTVTINNSGAIIFDFNYHHADVNAKNLPDKVRGSINRCKDHALDLIKSLYDIEGFEPVSFQVAVDKQEMEAKE